MQGLLSVIRGASFIGELLLEPDMEWEFLANIDYMDRVNILQGYESTANLYWTENS